MEHDEPDLLEPGTVLPGGYVIEELLVQGQVNTAYVARSPEGERVAAHVLHRALVDDMGDWFQSGVMLRRSLHHPALPRTLAVGFIERNRPIEVTELLEGETFRELIDNRSVPFAPAAVARIVREIASALEYLHLRVPPVIHRALMPEYIFLSAPDGDVKLLGVGMADRPRFAVRRPPYQSPEELAGVSTFTPRTDVFSLATLTFEMLTGHPAFSGTAGEVLTRMNPASLPSVTAWRAELPPRIDAVLHRAWSLTPDLRPADATDFVAELSEIFRETVERGSPHRLETSPFSKVVVVRRRHAVLGDHTPVDVPPKAPPDEPMPELSPGARALLEKSEPTQVGNPPPPEGAAAEGSAKSATDRDGLPMPKLFHRQVTAPKAVPAVAQRSPSPSPHSTTARVARVRTGASRSIWSWDKEKAAASPAVANEHAEPRAVVPLPPQASASARVHVRRDHVTHEEKTVPDAAIPASVTQPLRGDTKPELRAPTEVETTAAPPAEAVAPSVNAPEPLAERSAPLAERSAPLAERSAPLAERSAPLAERSEPPGERSEPLAERSEPLAQPQEPAAKPQEPPAHTIERTTDPEARDASEDTTRIEQVAANPGAPAPSLSADTDRDLGLQAFVASQIAPAAPSPDETIQIRESLPSVRALPSPVPEQADDTRRVTPLRSSSDIDRVLEGEPTLPLVTRSARPGTPPPSSNAPTRSEFGVSSRAQPRSRRPEDIASPDEPTATVRMPRESNDRSNVYALIAAALIANALVIAGIAHAIASVSVQRTVIERVVPGPCPQCPVCPPPAATQAPVAPTSGLAPTPEVIDAGTGRAGRPPRPVRVRPAVVRRPVRTGPTLP